ncbi:MAG: DedA family protein [Candidatus Kapabacteria bacterium]|jgi:membrane-associated protein|nr:DedA family protein [Candidatus Kapabacteria bacterium]
MNVLSFLVDFIIHIDVHLAELTAQYGPWIYVILFLIVFAETGLVIAPFLPGDSLLFAAGTICALGGMNVWLLMGILVVAAILGDTINYSVGRRFGRGLVKGPLARFIKPAHLERTHAFYEKYGGKTIIFARFVPIVRTFAPFVAGIGTMNYRTFIYYNVVGGLVWVVSFTLLGYYFGTLEFIRKQFSLVILAIIIISVLPGVVELVRARRARKAT